ncbi:hypothetical protein I317_01134 [Kwoniella heveanensis CBS 569]|uniref:LysM domain-containing protein n=1 Tax=Kwoniella heveanensis BCC8398 TaxID=1296120 RepID=A0A1B9GUH8_9TREE|nr:hypothetical protein I316_03694 [Kwoniella heveanensis BCC8398]OCF45082.1 hypothetical protein I317_01134 [Kwoniella heveanensis CBS 569]
MFAALALAVLPLLSSVMAIDGCTRNATVVSGDTCDSISRKYGVSTYQLALVNDAVIAENCDNLEPDQVVCLGIEGQDCTKVYTVVADDTCAYLQETYGISNETLWSNNPQIDAACDNIYVGEVLCVDTEAYQYPQYNETLYNALAYTYLPYCDEE